MALSIRFSLSALVCALFACTVFASPASAANEAPITFGFTDLSGGYAYSAFGSSFASSATATPMFWVNGNQTGSFDLKLSRGAFQQGAGTTNPSYRGNITSAVFNSVNCNGGSGFGQTPAPTLPSDCTITVGGATPTMKYSFSPSSVSPVSDAVGASVNGALASSPFTPWPTSVLQPFKIGIDTTAPSTTIKSFSGMSLAPSDTAAPVYSGGPGGAVLAYERFDNRSAGEAVNANTGSGVARMNLWQQEGQGTGSGAVNGSLAKGTCPGSAAFGPFTLNEDTTSDSAIIIDKIQLTEGSCYRFKLTGRDNVGNETSDANAPVVGTMFFDNEVPVDGFLTTRSANELRWQNTSTTSIRYQLGNDGPNGSGIRPLSPMKKTAPLVNGECPSSMGLRSFVAGGTYDPIDDVANPGLRGYTENLTTGFFGIDKMPVVGGGPEAGCVSYEFDVQDWASNSVTWPTIKEDGLIKIDREVPSLSLSNVTLVNNPFNQHLSTDPLTGAPVLWINGRESGSFSVALNAADKYSQVKRIVHPALGTGWTSPMGFVPTMTSTPVTNTSTTPYTTTPGVYNGQTAEFSFSSGAQVGAGETQVAEVEDNAGNKRSVSLKIISDQTGPQGFAIATSDFSNSSTNEIALTIGSDTGVGLARYQLQRRSAAWADEACDEANYSAWQDLGSLNYSGSSYQDTGLAKNTCYQYRVVATDHVDNETIIVAANTLHVDADAPLLTLPSTVTLEATAPDGAKAGSYAVAADDIVQGIKDVTCTPLATTYLPIGTNTVTCSAQDSHDNVRTGSFTVLVEDTTPPALTVPTTITREATGHSGAQVSFSPTAQDIVDEDVDIACTPASGSTFALGTHVVNCLASDDHANVATGSFAVNVVDTAAPVVTVPQNMDKEATGPNGAPVTFTASAADVADPSPSLSCVPASGSTFPVGSTVVACSAVDGSGNAGTASFTITIADTTAPVLHVPSDMIVEASQAGGALVTFSADAIDGVDGPVPSSCSHVSGALFPIADTRVTCSVSDAAGNDNEKSFTVTVQDTKAPVITVPQDMLVESLTPDGTQVDFAASAVDAEAGALTPTCSPASGTVFVVDTTTVTCMSVDNYGNSSTKSFDVLVYYGSPDTMPPAAFSLIQPAAKTVPAVTDGSVDPSCMTSSRWVDTTQPTLKWTASTDEYGPVVYKVTVDGAVVATVSGLSYTPATNLFAGTHSWSVAAYDRFNNETRTATSEFKIDLANPDTIPTMYMGQNILWTNIPKFDYTVTDTGNSVGAAGCVARVRLTLNGVERFVTVNASGTYSFAGTLAEGTYDWLLAAYDAAGHEYMQSGTITYETVAPVAPVVTATADGGSKVALSWALPAGDTAASIARYIVSKQEDDGSWIIVTNNNLDTTATVSGLAEQTEYHFRVKAVDKAGNVGAEGEASATTLDTTAPTKPQHACGEILQEGDTQATVCWWSGDNPVGTVYRIYNCTSSLPGTLLATFVSTVTPPPGGGFALESHDVTVPAYQKVYLCMQAVDAAGNESLLSDQQEYPAMYSVPFAPSTISASETNGVVNLQWSASQNALGYKIYQLVGDTWTFFKDAAGTSTSISGLADASTYTFAVTAVTPTGTQTVRSDSAVITLPDRTAPLKPAITATATSDSAIRLAWTVPAADTAASISKYTVLQKNADGTTTLLTTTTLNAYDVGGLRPGASYTFSVTAQDVAGNVSAAAEVAGQTLADKTAPSVPTALAVSARTASSISLTWNQPADNVGVTSYKVYDNGALATTTAGLSATLSGLGASSAHTLTVTALDAAGNESAAATVSTTTLAPPIVDNPPAAPSSVRVTVKDVKSITLAWNAPADLDVVRYRVYRLDGAQETLLGETAGLGYSITGLIHDTAYAFVVKSVDAAGQVSISSVAAATKTMRDTVAPSTVTGVKVVRRTGKTVTLSWAPAKDNWGIKMYQVYIYKGTKLLKFVYTYKDVNNYTVTGLSGLTSYTFKVRAMDLAMLTSKAYSAPVTTKTMEAVAPKAPTVFATTAQTQTSVALKWTAAVDAGGVASYTITAKGPNGVAITRKVGAAARTYNFTGLTRNTSYTFTIIATDKASNTSSPKTIVAKTKP